MAWQAPKERRPLRLGHLVWGLLCLFLMAWGFVLGLWVGQGSLATPEQVAGLRQWASFLPGLGQPSPEAAEAPADKQAPPPSPPHLSFYTNLEKGEAPPPSQVAVKPAEPPAPPPPKPPETPATPPARPPVYGEVRPVAPLTPPPPKPPTPAQTPVKPPAQPPAKPAPPPAQARQGRFTVQVASFKDEDQARELLAQLRGGGHPAYMVPVRLEGVGMRYRVRVGPFYDLDVAQGAAGRIRLQLTLAAYVTRED
ncbi:MAG: SPOR domain-containing protein [Desulfarculus sp.]|nr:SPOR domain-containing protein [Desulfarculus sp.]